MRPLLRPALLLATVAPCFVAASAGAQILDGGTTATTLSSGDLFIGVQHEMNANLSDFDVARFFNKANCDCEEPVYIYVALTGSGFAKRTLVDHTGNIEFWVGSACNVNDTGRLQRCKQIGSATMAAFLNDGRANNPTNARVLSTYTNAIIFDGGTVVGEFTPNPDCTIPSGLESFNQTIFVINYDATGQPVALATRQVYIDLKAPPAPDSDGITVQGGNEAVVINWPGVDSSIYTDILGYQVLCNRGGALQVFSDNTFGASFQTCSSTLPANAGVQELNPQFVCSPLLSPTTRSFRVKILQNDITYGVSVVTIDRSSNASTPDIFYATATKTKSFYDVYRNDDDYNHGGSASGGWCALGAGRSSRGALGGLGAAFAITALMLARRRRRH